MNAPTARPRQRSAARLFAAPGLIALTSLIGLIAGLTGEGVRDLIAWLFLSLPVAVVAIAWRRRG